MLFYSFFKGLVCGLKIVAGRDRSMEVVLRVCASHPLRWLSNQSIKNLIWRVKKNPACSNKILRWLSKISIFWHETRLKSFLSSAPGSPLPGILKLSEKKSFQLPFQQHSSYVEGIARIKWWNWRQRSCGKIDNFCIQSWHQVWTINTGQT